jgi:hypothetical protein
VVPEATENITEDTIRGGGFYFPEDFLFQTCNKQKLHMSYASIGVGIHSIIQDGYCVLLYQDQCPAQLLAGKASSNG